MEVVLNFLQDLAYFILLIGLVVFFHEAGHFVVAKLVKVKVHTFSLGFGPKIVGFRRGETEYKVAAVPIGGYVKMLGEDPNEEILPEDRGRAFHDKAVWQRLAIVTAGPMMNLVLACAIFFGIGLSHLQLNPAEIGYVLPESPAAAAELKPGDRIVAINGEPVESWEDLTWHVAPRAGEQIEVAIARGGQTLTKQMVPMEAEQPVMLDITETVGRIGVSHAYLGPQVGILDPAGPAAVAGLETFDKITQIDGQKIEKFVEIEQALLASAGRTVTLTAQRFKPDSKPPMFEDAYEKEARTIALPIPAAFSSLATLGMTDASDFVAHVKPGGAAEKAGLKVGDRLVNLDGQSATLGKIFTTVLMDRVNEHRVGWEHQGQFKEAGFKPELIPAETAKKDLGIARDIYDNGFFDLRKPVFAAPVANEHLFSYAVKWSVRETKKILRMIGLGVQLMVTGKLSLQSLGGPLMIGQLAAMAGREKGWSPFFWMTALISLNLGLINLMPIPVLDGGHVVFLAIEAISRRPISRRVKEPAMMVGVILLFALMGFAIRNDIYRFFLG